MSWVNHYQPPAAVLGPDPYGPEPYDVNWPYPIHTQTLENDVVQLVPLIPRIHADLLWTKIGRRARYYYALHARTVREPAGLP
jgi:hypothetical protein